jgi:hypothetical protein
MGAPVGVCLVVPSPPFPSASQGNRLRLPVVRSGRCAGVKPGLQRMLSRVGTDWEESLR